MEGCLRGYDLGLWVWTWIGGYGFEGKGKGIYLATMICHSGSSALARSLFKPTFVHE